MTRGTVAAQAEGRLEFHGAGPNQQHIDEPAAKQKVKISKAQSTENVS